MFFCEFYKISKNTFFTEHLRTTASKHSNSLVFILSNIKISINWND